ncbi:unnamed protein product [Soboliphyme baturini]|uniref:Delta-like protein n=1 Tax=Soboliphyme baturini TaxID=241478 RepID=A0A183IV09_9BILA|nr:unnamed protein product [Soboliphyme baturini]
MENNDTCRKLFQEAVRALSWCRRSIVEPRTEPSSRSIQSDLSRIPAGRLSVVMAHIHCASRWTLFWLLYCLVMQMRTVSSSGVLEFQLVSFENVRGVDVRGRCCLQPSPDRQQSENFSRRCAKSCRLLLRVCLKEYQSEVKAEPPCTYGSRMVNVQQFGNRIDFPTLKSGTLSVIVEAWHNVSGPTNSSQFEAASDGVSSSSSSPTTTTERNVDKQLMFQYAQGQVLPAGTTWKEERQEDEHGAIQFKIRVRCDPHYYGPKCEVYCRPRDVKDNQAPHYRCSETGAKICVEGWTGPDCKQAICKAGCHPVYGSCQQPGECICQLGYIGENCDTCQRYPSCQHGTCEKPFDCTCNEGWGGKFCNQDLNYCTHHKPCVNGGTCTNTGAGSYTCTCSPDFTGTNCETKIDGRHCQISARTCAEDPCQNGATCTEVPHRGYLCICNPGWEGSNCDIERDECQSSPCLHGGSCVTIFGGFQCVCPVGYAGFRCEKNVDDCSEHSCLNGGTCEDEVNSFRCHCLPGYMGTLCQINVNDCLTLPCANGGTCFDMVNDFRCMCRPGFKGKDCSIDINECESSPCRNGGSCEDLMDDYLCHCPPCYTGKQCTIRTDDCLWEATFRPYVFTYNVTMSPLHDGVVGGKSSKQEGDRVLLSSSDIPLLVGMPLVGVFLLFVLILLLVLFYLYRRTRSHVAAQQRMYVNDVDVYKRENEWNERRCHEFMPNFDCGAEGRLGSMKKNSARRCATIKAKNLTESHPDLYKLVAVSKVNYDDVKSKNKLFSADDGRRQFVYDLGPTASRPSTNCGDVISVDSDLNSPNDDDVFKVRLSDCVSVSESESEEEGSVVDSGLISPVPEPEHGNSTLTVGDVHNGGDGVRTLAAAPEPEPARHRYDTDHDATVGLPCRTGCPRRTCGGDQQDTGCLLDQLLSLPRTEINAEAMDWKPTTLFLIPASVLTLTSPPPLTDGRTDERTMRQPVAPNRPITAAEKQTSL